MKLYHNLVVALWNVLYSSHAASLVKVPVKWGESAATLTLPRGMSIAECHVAMCRHFHAPQESLLESASCNEMKYVTIFGQRGGLDDSADSDSSDDDDGSDSLGEVADAYLRAGGVTMRLVPHLDDLRGPPSLPQAENLNINPAATADDPLRSLSAEVWVDLGDVAAGTGVKEITSAHSQNRPQPGGRRTLPQTPADAEGSSVLSSVAAAGVGLVSYVFSRAAPGGSDAVAAAPKEKDIYYVSCTLPLCRGPSHLKRCYRDPLLADIRFVYWNGHEPRIYFHSRTCCRRQKRLRCHLLL